jgi:hypothetical protein
LKRLLIGVLCIIPLSAAAQTTDGAADNGVPTSLASGAACSSTGGATGKTLGQFITKGGQIIGPDGKVFIARGISILDAMLDQIVGDDGQPLLSKFPGVNFVRVAVNAGYSTTVAEKAVLVLTAKGIIVVFTNYNATPGGSQTEISGSSLTQATDWYSAIGKEYANNPYVWFTTLNEPTNIGGSIAAEQKAVHDAIRGAGNNNIIMFDLSGGGPTTDGLDPSIYSSMHNVAWDAHYYAWVVGKGNSDVNAHRQALAREVAAAQGIQSADGAMPVIIGEWGDSTNGSSIDGGWRAVAQAVTEYSGGNAAWIWDWPGSGGDRLVQGGGLTPLGEVVAASIAGPAPTAALLMDCNIRTVGAHQSPAAQPSQSNDPSSGNQTQRDSLGNEWAMPGGAVTQNGVAVPGGYGTKSLSVVNGDEIYGEDAHGKGWFTYSTATQLWTHSQPPPGWGATASTIPLPSQNQQAGTAATAQTTDAGQEMLQQADDLIRRAETAPAQNDQQGVDDLIAAAQARLQAAQALRQTQ